MRCMLVRYARKMHAYGNRENSDLSLSIPRRTPGHGGVGPSVRICHRTTCLSPGDDRFVHHHYDGVSPSPGDRFAIVRLVLNVPRSSLYDAWQKRFLLTAPFFRRGEARLPNQRGPLKSHTRRNTPLAAPRRRQAMQHIVQSSRSHRAVIVR
jgi:hypothetical protein